jgi:hypothetical protein
VHKTFVGVCMRLIWLSYFDPRKDTKRVWWPSGDLTDTGMTTPCHDRHALRKNCPFRRTNYFYYASHNKNQVIIISIEDTYNPRF